MTVHTTRGRVFFSEGCTDGRDTCPSKSVRPELTEDYLEFDKLEALLTEMEPIQSSQTRSPLGLLS